MELAITACQSTAGNTAFAFAQTFTPIPVPSSSKALSIERIQ
jgi:hypothetical protein